MIKLITVGGTDYKLVFDEFNEEVDIDSLLKIDYSNLIGEIITFPVIVNRFGKLLADMEAQVSEKKLNVDIFEAKVKERLRVEITNQKGGKAATVDELNSAIMLDKGFQAMKKSFIETQKNRDYIQSVFWSSKDKSGKLDKLSMSMQTGDITDDMIQGKVNNITIKKTKKLIG